MQISAINDFFAAGLQPIVPNQDGLTLKSNPTNSFEYASELNSPTPNYRGQEKLYQAYEVSVLYPKPLSNPDFYNLTENSFEGISYDLYGKIVAPKGVANVSCYGNTIVTYNAYTDAMTENSEKPYPRLSLDLEKSDIGLEPRVLGDLRIKDRDITVKLCTYRQSSADLVQIPYYTDDIAALKETLDAQNFYFTTYISCAELRIDGINYAISIPIFTLTHKDKVSDADYLDELYKKYGELEYGTNEYYQVINNNDRLLDSDSFAILKNAALQIQAKLTADFLQ